MKAFDCKPGKPLPLGATVTLEGVNFSVFSRHATSLSLLLFEEAGPTPAAEIVLDPKINRTGDIWHVLVVDMDTSLRYAYRAQGPYDPKGTGHWFKGDSTLLDPYARALEGGEVWGEEVARRRCYVLADDFDWEGDRPLNLPIKDSVIYELHVRGYTVLESSQVTSPGTYKGLTEKIPYIKSLGVTAVELLPVFEFNELENKRVNPSTGERLKNFWGYSTMAFFAPKASYASTGWAGNQVREFKGMVKAFHKAGLEVILDVVFNHTAEMDANGPVISFRGLDNVIYYALEPESKEYVNISGCGNTMSCNHPVVQAFILDCLRYWVTEMHVDGFRFDLASVLGRDHKGDLLSGPSLIDTIEQEPVLAHTKIIAEAWDLGIKQVGEFPGRWAEWNSCYRDDIRRFLRGDRGMVQALATRIAGSSDLYQSTGRRPYNSINFITCHDGFTLYDLFSYKEKHNEENGEDNRDGTNDSLSSNSGVEGPTEDVKINELRRRRMKTAFTILMVSQGVPMVLAGDEFGRTQRGNNNSYCQDNDSSWVNWKQAEENAGLVRFFRHLAHLRKAHPIFRRSSFLTGLKKDGHDFPDVGWHGLEVDRPDWSQDARALAFVLNGREVGKGKLDDDFFVIVNGDEVEHDFEIPQPPRGRQWFRMVDTSKAPPEDILDEDKAEPVSMGKMYPVPPATAVVFISRAPL
ncbi:MAG: glycogen debranching protein GlgX [Thermodesulfobacteriota bacterium]|nr:glycogen debranching protein GlgX [Thermodesulfobacteriota bacterium]